MSSLRIVNKLVQSCCSYQFKIIFYCVVVVKQLRFSENASLTIIARETEIPIQDVIV